MSISQGYAYLQVNSEDKSEVEKFKVHSHGKSKKIQKDKADKLRKAGWRCRVIWEPQSKEWVTYKRK